MLNVQCGLILVVARRAAGWLLVPGAVWSLSGVVCWEMLSVGGGSDLHLARSCVVHGLDWPWSIRLTKGGRSRARSSPLERIIR